MEVGQTLQDGFVSSRVGGDAQLLDQLSVKDGIGERRGNDLGFRLGSADSGGRRSLSWSGSSFRRRSGMAGTGGDQEQRQQRRQQRRPVHELTPWGAVWAGAGLRLQKILRKNQSRVHCRRAYSGFVRQRIGLLGGAIRGFRCDLTGY